MILQPYINPLGKLVKALLYLIVLLCLPDASVYTSSTQKQAADFVRTEIIFSHPQLARKTISYQQAIAKLRGSKILSADHGLAFAQLALLHNRGSKVAFNYIAKQHFGYTPFHYLYQLKTIPRSSDELPPHLSRG